MDLSDITAEKARVRVLRRGIEVVLAVIGFAALSLVPLGGSSGNSEIGLEPWLPRSAHEAYGYRLALEGFRRPPARDWLLASERAVLQPRRADLPVASSGRFEAGTGQALGYRFTARGGRRVTVEVAARSVAEGSGRDGTGADDRAALFVDLFFATADGVEYLRSAPPLRTRGPTARQRVELTVLDDGEYLLRVQPSLEFSGDYDVQVRSEPLLAFPVQGFGARAIQSGFGAERDGGARSHRGVDIFAPRGTAVVAAMDGWVSRVDTTARGGNVVWLQPLFGNMRLYYAHLDTQLVERGEFVLAGDVVGTVGNTGNARTTPPHLHFGVYVRQRGRRGGARDPYPFLD
ncbi:MAG: M23 family metallopeptidase [Gammaproteobacteria bacterium]|nr:M23 family metallopeptidase [Gammaproteobacteria bacterium]